MDQNLIIKLLENQQRITEYLKSIAEKHEHWLHQDHKDIEKLQDRVDELESKVKAENDCNLRELFENLNPNK